MSGRGMLWVLACAVTATACLREPKFMGPAEAGPGDDAGLDGADAPLDAAGVCPTGTTGVSIERVGSNLLGARVCAPDYYMEFSDSGAHFPHLLAIGGTFVIERGDLCNDERGVGIALYPSLNINGEAAAPVQAPTLTTPLTGPHVAKVAIDWSATYDCDMQGTLGNRSTFTFFPNGRIARYDRISHPATVSASNCDVCPGGGSASFFLTSYMSLIAEAGSTLVGANLGALNNYRDEIDGNDTTMQAACLDTRNRQIAFGWRDVSTRIRVAKASPRTLAFIYDLVQGQGTIGPVNEEIRTTMLLGNSQACTALRDEALHYVTQDLDLVINGGATGVGPSHDGIYGGETEAGTNNVIDPGVGPVTLSPEGARIPGGYAVLIEFGAQQTTNIQVSRSGPGGAPPADWVSQQVVGASQVLFYFRYDLVTNQTITITPG